MKRLTTILLLATMPLAMFADYGDYGDYPHPNPGPSAWVVFLGIISFVWSILAIILFFKVWGMTNNVIKIKNNILRSNDPQLLRKYRLLGQTDKAVDFVIQGFMNSMQNKMENSSNKLSIEEDVAELEFSLSQLGVKLPEEFKKLKVLGDYVRLGSMKTLARAKFEEEQAAKQKEEQSSEK